MGNGNPKAEAFQKLPGVLSKVVSTLERRQPIPDSRRATADPTYCLERAEILFACYRRDDANDPEKYAAAIAAVLSGYSREIVEYVTHPKTGLPITCKWPPTAFEVNEACQKIVERDAKLFQEAVQIRRQLDEREAVDKRRREPRLSIEELQAKYGGPNWGINTRPGAGVAASRGRFTEQSNQYFREKEFQARGQELPSDQFAASPTLRDAIERQRQPQPEPESAEHG